jgi:hypothetical protein
MRQKHRLSRQSFEYAISSLFGKWFPLDFSQVQRFFHVNIAWIPCSSSFPVQKRYMQEIESRTNGAAEKPAQDMCAFHDLIFFISKLQLLNYCV